GAGRHPPLRAHGVQARAAAGRPALRDRRRLHGAAALVAVGRIALIGDRDDRVIAHQAIPLALDLAREAEAVACAWDWVSTSTLGGDLTIRLAGYDGVWCIPGSPYANGAGAIAAIRVARENGCPFLGTC